MDRRSGTDSDGQADCALGSAIARFCAELVAVRQRSPKTEKAYRCDLQQFATVVGFETRVDALERAHIEQWLAHLRSRVLKTSSMRRKVACVRGFLRQQHRRGAVHEDPFAMVEVEFGRTRPLTRTLTDRDFDLLLAEADRRAEFGQRGPRQHLLPLQRDRAMIWLLCGTGLRVGELVALKTADIDLEDGVMRVNGKGGRQRLAFMVDGDRERLACYLQTRAACQFDHDQVFVNHRGGPITTEGVRSVVARLAKAGGVQRRVTPHMLRHTAATRLLQHGANLRVVQEFLGHASIRMTERYTHVSATALREAVTHHSPLRGCAAHNSSRPGMMWEI